jgi:hypothetical protein
MQPNTADRPASGRRLNPFAFPAETNVRFSLLVVATVMLAVQLAYLLILYSNPGSTGILDSSQFELKTPNPQQPEAAYASEAVSTVSSSLRPVGIVLGVIAAILALAFGVAAGVYRGHPARIRRAQKLKPIPPGRHLKFRAEVAALAAQAGVSPSPEIEMAPKSSSADGGQVFGVSGRYQMRLSAGMPGVMANGPAIFRATLLHELAHIANGDVARAYFSQALWLVIALVMLAPVELVFVGLYGSRLLAVVQSPGGLQAADVMRLLTVSTPTLAWNLLQMAGLLVLFSAIRASLLRAREVYADWRAALWGAGGGLAEIFAANKPSSGDWFRLWRLHPPPRDRQRFLDDPRRLFAISNDVPLLVGMLIGLAASGVLLLTPFFTLGVASTLVVVIILMVQAGGLLTVLGFALAPLTVLLFALIAVGPQVGLAYLTAGSLGLQAQKDGVAGAASGEKRGLGGYVALLRPSLLFAVGMQLGFLITPGGVFAPVNNLIGFQGQWLSLLAIPALTLGWLLGVSAAVWLWLAWARYTAIRLLGASAGDRPPRGRRRFLTFWLSLMLWMILIAALTAQTQIWLPNLTTSNMLPPEIALLGVIIGLGLMLGLAGLGLLLVELRRGGAITCRVCKHKNRRRHAVGQTCEQCGSELAGWLIAHPA